MSWRIRTEFEPRGLPAETPQRVLEGLREGEWEPTDEVRGPGDPTWIPIEDHPAFADAVAEMGPPPAEKPDETRLDMNPLIDVALVLLIFFILTTSYANLKRLIDLPNMSGDGGAVKAQNLNDRVIRVKLILDPTGKPIAKFDGSSVGLDGIDAEMKAQVRATGNKELLATIDDQVPWELAAKLDDAAKGAGIGKVYWPKKK